MAIKDNGQEVEVDPLFGLPVGEGNEEQVSRQHPAWVNRDYHGSDQSRLGPSTIPVYDGETLCM